MVKLNYAFSIKIGTKGDIAIIKDDNAAIGLSLNF
jgi:hypothetical protein